ncbi:biotin--[acetyl-CoA-carboxylase] ligase [uncultured Thiothrix sp.]|uniref:biotin--[acetyl-CoA-carboxylase] ligase n=1 Tax=uncultured Thiothrix sp. TaxID=223185 RepID=UPI0026261683|nr:biotin--[acetyl-CoA-carboxylase] ligase [uncultured Thiothrix sp.]HMT93594.1 biotin--[acetyl-CoA-carboxylase] ligase [Thiolinea sp.]
MLKFVMPAVIPLSQDQILTELAPELQAVLQQIYIFPSLASTNTWLLEQPNTCFSVCLAEEQTAGRGRRGRTWQSPNSGNIYFSLRWCFQVVPANYGCLSLVVGVVVAEALAAYGLQGQMLKWPNDIYYQGQKLGGILLQTTQPLQQVVIGIGLNTGMQRATVTTIDQAWCDLSEILEQNIDRNRLIAAILKQLIPALQAFPRFNMADFQQQWQRWDWLTDQAVRIDTGKEILQGRACGLDEQGQLQVALADGSRRAFSSADVSVRQVS